MLVSSCATTYKQAKSPKAEGYYATLLQQGMYEITFNGNEYTDSIIVQDYALLRAAEICLENGYKTFDIVRSEDKTKTNIDSIPIYGYYTSALVFSETTPKIMLIIKCSREDNLTFIAEEIKANLRKKYRLVK